MKMKFWWFGQNINACAPNSGTVWKPFIFIPEIYGGLKKRNYAFDILQKLSILSIYDWDDDNMPPSPGQYPSAMEPGPSSFSSHREEPTTECNLTLEELPENPSLEPGQESIGARGPLPSGPLLPVAMERPLSSPPASTKRGLLEWFALALLYCFIVSYFVLMVALIVYMIVCAVEPQPPKDEGFGLFT